MMMMINNIDIGVPAVDQRAAAMATGRRMARGAGGMGREMRVRGRSRSQSRIKYMPAGADPDGVAPDRQRVVLPGLLPVLPIRAQRQRGLHQRKNL